MNLLVPLAVAYSCKRPVTAHVRTLEWALSKMAPFVSDLVDPPRKCPTT